LLYREGTRCLFRVPSLLPVHNGRRPPGIAAPAPNWVESRVSPKNSFQCKDGLALFAHMTLIVGHRSLSHALIAYYRFCCVFLFALAQFARYFRLFFGKLLLHVPLLSVSCRVTVTLWLAIVFTFAVLF